MSEEIDYKKLYESEKKKVAVLEKENNLFKTDPIKKGYFSLCRLVNLQIETLNDYDLSSSIRGKKSEDATFERMQVIWSELPKMITSMNGLKRELRVTTKDEEEYSDEDKPFIESIAETRK